MRREEAGPAAQPAAQRGGRGAGTEFSDSLVTAGEGERFKTSGTATEPAGRDRFHAEQRPQRRQPGPGDTSRLEGGSCEEEVAGRSDRPSWREKLEVGGILCCSPERKDLSPGGCERVLNLPELDKRKSSPPRVEGTTDHVAIRSPA